MLKSENEIIFPTLLSSVRCQTVRYAMLSLLTINL